ncbi:hypothetical protein MBRA_03802 [Methylobacterium brachiatum]|nr:hypothetical protein MBRA_03802 [Methylobacterium brachiatum]
MTQKPFKENDLFKGTPNWSLNACVGDNGGPYDMYDYAQGFLEAARVVIRRSTDDDAIVDTLVYPACFNFRHGIELFIKYGVGSLSEIKNAKIEYSKKHSLLGDWKIFRAESVGVFAFDEKDLDIVDKTIACFEEVDPNGQIFRYPESIKGIQHLKEWSLINLGRVGGALDEIMTVFKGWHFMIEVELEAKWDGASAAE